LNVIDMYINRKLVFENIKSSDTISLIKCMLEMKTGIPVDKQRLIYKGPFLEDYRTIAHYDIEDGATIHLYERMVGC
uniref:Ubiquitin-like domain-containing protein n=1 Tax=Meloidogyne javanica TaxID=6303 RepID=A0A915LBW0_MELJA